MTVEELTITDPLEHPYRGQHGTCRYVWGLNWMDGTAFPNLLADQFVSSAPTYGTDGRMNGRTPDRIMRVLEPVGLGRILMATETTATATVYSWDCPCGATVQYTRHRLVTVPCHAGFPDWWNGSVPADMDTLRQFAPGVPKVCESYERRRTPYGYFGGRPRSSCQCCGHTGQHAVRADSLPEDSDPQCVKTYRLLGIDLVWLLT